MKNDAFIDALAENLTPVRPLRDLGILLGLIAFTVLGWLVIASTLGVRADVLTGSPHPIFLLRAGTLAVLGGICTISALAMARPGIGRSNRAWQSALAMAGVAPVAAVAVAVTDPAVAFQTVWQSSAAWCLSVSLLAATGFASIIVAHLRRGAPVSPERAAVVTGLASGSLGVLVYSLHCPADSVVYIGLWYSLAIALATLVARLAVPPLIRW